jgi:hypothetical protein
MKRFVCIWLADAWQEYFVFADSTEEKETILEGLQMAIV